MSSTFMFAAFIALLQLNFKVCDSTAVAADRFCTVKLTSGTIRGNCSNAGHDAYTKIPYARPPVGALRLEAPLPSAKWTGVRAATEPVVRCVQYKPNGVFSGSEDCLYVNVYVPKKPQSQPLKVLVWIYPGAFQFGDPFLSPEVVMSVGGAIVVTFAYRLGPTRFLSTKDRRIPGNFGLKDQRLAVQWVEQNIRAFGGDPKQIILSGDSAGGASVEYHMITGSGRNIKAFVSLSGSILNPWAFTWRPEISARQLGKLLNCPFDAPGNSYKNCLKAKRIEDIWKATIDMHKFYAFSGALFRPTVEASEVPDAFLARDPIELIRAGKYRDKPYLVGIVAGEGAYLAASLLQLNANNTEVIEELNERWLAVCPIMFYYDETQTATQQWRSCQQLRRRYMCGRPFHLDSYKLVERMFGDEYFHKGIDKSVQLHRAAGQKVYRYIANLPARYSVANLMAGDRSDLCFGSVHTVDAFGILPPTSAPLAPTNGTAELELKTMRNLIKLVLSMTKVGSPPVYNNMTLPPNINNAAPDQCLYFTYGGGEHIAKCQLEKIDCNGPLASVRCN